MDTEKREPKLNAPPSTLRPWSILVVDDDLGIRSVMQRLLQSWGYHAEIRSCAEDAIEAIQESPPNIVMTDLDMGFDRLNGIDLARWVKESHDHVDVIVMTGKASIETAAEAIRLCAFDYLLKPFHDYNLVRSSLQRALEKQSLQRELQQRMKELQASRASFSSIVEKSADGILVVDKEHVIRYGNPTAKRFLNTEILHEKPLQNALSHTLPNKLQPGCTLELQQQHPETNAEQYTELHTEATTWEGKDAYLLTLRDITQRKQAERALRESEERYALAVRGANDGLWDWDLSRSHLYLSPRWLEMLGYEEHELSNKPEEWFSRIHENDLDKVKQELEQHFSGQTSHYESEYRMQHKDGTYRWMLCRGIAVRDQDGEAIRMTGSQTDVTQRKQVEQQLVHDAFHDALTDLPNRALFMDRLERALKRAERRPNYLFAVLFLDLDRFKTLNDSLGHLIGDQFLISIARRLETCLRKGDSIARLGGDEFTILLDDIKDISDAIHVAERIQQALKRPFKVGSYEVFTSASIGITLSSMGYERAEDILRDADTAMYHAKDLGKARYELFNQAMHTQAVSLLRLENDLRRALERNEFMLHYQPIVSLHDGKIRGVEALLRWQHPSRGMIAPDDFIPIAEETGFIVPLGFWVLEEACRQLQTWRQEHAHCRELTVSINLSYRQFLQYDLVDQIQEILARTQLPAEYLKVELTENVLMEHTDLVNRVLAALKALDVQIDMDDFGTGYSSLSYLHRFPIDTLKIDRSFVSRMELEDESREIVRAIIALARNLGMNVIAEGIEQSEHLRHLQELNCHYGQGYLFSKPIDSQELSQMLLEHPCAQFTQASA